MKKQNIKIVVGILVVGLEVFSALSTTARHQEMRNREAADTYRNKIIELSASLRAGELNRYFETKQTLENQVATDKSRYKNTISDYLSRLQENESLIYSNQATAQMNEELQQAKNLDSQLEILEKSERKTGAIERVLETGKKIKDCKSYCSNKEYEKLGEEYSQAIENLKNEQIKQNQEFADKIKTDEILEQLAN